MELTDELKTLFVQTAKTLKGFERRHFQAQTVKALGRGGQHLAERELGWNRKTLRKAMHELESGFACIGDIGRRRRKRAEEHLPNLLEDIKAIVDGQSQTDPQFRSNRLYTRLTAAEVRCQLIAQKSYQNAELPTERTIRTKLNDLGYHRVWYEVCRVSRQRAAHQPRRSCRGIPCRVRGMRKAARGGQRRGQAARRGSGRGATGQ